MPWASGSLCMAQSIALCYAWLVSASSEEFRMDMAIQVLILV